MAVLRVIRDISNLKYFCQGQPTTFIEVAANLDASDAVPLLAWDLNDPASTANFSTTLTIYNSTGRGETLDIYFRKVADCAWDYHVLTGYGEFTVEQGLGRLEFNVDGSLARWVQYQPLILPAWDGRSEQPIALNFGKTTQRRGTGLDGVTSLQMPSNVSRQAADGRSGVLGYSCDETAHEVTSREAFPPDEIADHPAASDAVPSIGCAGRATTRIAFAGNLWSGSPQLLPLWAASAAEATSNCVDFFGCLAAAKTGLYRTAHQFDRDLGMG